VPKKPVIRRGNDVPEDKVAQLFRRAGMRRPVDDLPRIRRMLDESDLTLTAWIGDELVGICRSLTDWVFTCYVSELTVDPEQQTGGIGRTLLDETKKALGPDVLLILLSTPVAASYYPKVGFRQAENAWVLDRRPAPPRAHP
jgi:ribosomal protein S18 acetylase RimI-like enzyme